MPNEPVATVSLGLDGTCILMHQDGWREAMCGSIASYDSRGERLHTIYCAAIPEYGKETFNEKLSREIERVQKVYPNVLYVGVADGEKDNWIFFKRYTRHLILDFYHAREYISRAANAIFGRDKKSKAAWVEDWSHRLKHTQGAAGRLIKEVELRRANLDRKNFTEHDEELRLATGCYTNNKNRMRYASQLKHNLPFGSGVTEAACKTLIKQRMCISGSRWKEDGASFVLALRSLKLTKGR